MNPEVRACIRRLQEEFNATLDKFLSLDEEDLAIKSAHGCAMGGSVADLIMHNIDHERMHAGQVYTKRFELNCMQFSQRDRLLAEWYRERANLIASLIGLPDAQLDRHPEDGTTPTSIREVVEHVLYWDKDSADATDRQFTK